MKSAIRDDDPVIFLEAQGNYSERGRSRRRTSPSPSGSSRCPGRERDLTIVAHGYAVRRALRVAERLEGEGISAEVIDLRSLRPLDVQTVVDPCARPTAPCASSRAGHLRVTAELARIQRACFADLDAPVERVGGAGADALRPAPGERPPWSTTTRSTAPRQVLRESGMLARGVGRSAAGRARDRGPGGPGGPAGRQRARRPAPPAVSWQDRPMPEEIVMRASPTRCRRGPSPAGSSRRARRSRRVTS